MTTTWNEIYLEIFSHVPELINEHTQPVQADWRRFHLNQIVDIARHLEEPHAAEIDAAVAVWTTGKPFRKMSPLAEGWLLNRCTTAVSFATTHTIRGNILAKSVLVDPECSLEVAVKFLLTDWWKEHGIKEFSVACLLNLK